MNSIEEHDNHFELSINKQFTGTDNLAQFDIMIPPIALSKDNITKRCVMTLKSVMIWNLDKGNAHVGDATIAKQGCYNIQINGMGIKNNAVSAISDGDGAIEGINTGDFLFQHRKYGGGQVNNGVMGAYSNMAGNLDINEQRLCSNPFGNTINIKLMFGSKRDLLPVRSGQNATIKLCIDFINPKIDQNFI